MDDLPKLLCFVLMLGFGTSFLVVAVLEAIVYAIWRRRFSWRTSLGASAAVAILATLGCLVWLVVSGRTTY